MYLREGPSCGASWPNLVYQSEKYETREIHECPDVRRASVGPLFSLRVLDIQSNEGELAPSRSGKKRRVDMILEDSGIFGDRRQGQTIKFSGIIKPHEKVYQIGIHSSLVVTFPSSQTRIARIIKLPNLERQLGQLTGGGWHNQGETCIQVNDAVHEAFDRYELCLTNSALKLLKGLPVERETWLGCTREFSNTSLTSGEAFLFT
ncbi:hypothetical protein BDR03DRAFT_997006 [Suillus americanus]|nr:hypothetical protein BDR03DRAFT_997006 [Suillus americanus]